MSLGKKLAAYRKLAGFTQQQLGETLNLSPQAISKWENDLAEPDLATLRTLSELYKVPIGEILDQNISVSEPAADVPEDEEPEAPEIETKPEIIGFCKRCGITVNKDTVGEMSPEILCKNCCDRRDEEARNAIVARENKYKMEKTQNREKHSKKLVTSLIVAGIFAVVFLIIMISNIVNTGITSRIPVALIGTYVIFSYVACLFYDCIVSDMFFEWTSKSFRFPGLIFSFDLDGIICLLV